ncbi:hypothetical protein B0T25DRAFT_556043 [Lasiosphaeria hispida]|uniref:Uncharacterized protein n=1 Tax=Lasiosphaeria hispida TaxID=260671 RepID=A0AAJ0H9U2_9PEZI|nr:hypothetical protein B0T25DRAFT_556043 [Lasiosphaeria hispida]
MVQTSRSKAFVQKFREDTARDRKKAHEALTRHKQNLDKAYIAQQKQLADVFGSLKAAATATSTSSNKDNFLFRDTQLMIRQCRAVIKRHQVAEKDALEPRLTPPREAWRKDEKEMRQLLQYGLVYGGKLAEGLLSSENEAEVGKNGGLTEAEGMAVDLFERSRKAAEGETWGRVAHMQVKALAGVVRALAGGDEREGV